ncbi:MAG: ribosome biogenesis GTPase YlqF [Oscillospiraceae bacterium]|nr:ribosome biogenesis GTPase YlqF [Oscillospiraceae bacterium]
MAEKDITIQWFPGHMAKTRRLMTDSLKLVDAVVEVTDARIPLSSRNPEMDELVGRKPRIVLLNKCDTANETVTSCWIQKYRESGIPALATDCKSGKNVSKVLPLVRETLKDTIERWNQKGMTGRAVRLMIVGIPNVGKSSLINRLSGTKSTKVEDRPGVTKGKQWVTLSKDFELLDMPGVLWPKFEDQNVGLALAFTGAVKDDIMDMESLACHFIATLRSNSTVPIETRYKIFVSNDMTDYEILELIGRKRGFLVSGGEIDTERTGIMLLDEFRSGKLGRISLEEPK